MEDEWGDWAAPQAVPASAGPSRLPQQVPPLRNALHARQALDPSLFTEEDEFGGFEAAPATLPAHRADQQHHATHQQQQQQQHAVGQPELAKGDLAWLLDGRTGAWVEARVVSVDRTVAPPSYGVELPDGSYRETEGNRLLLRRPGSAPPPPPAASAVNGHYAAAPAIPFNHLTGNPAQAAASAGALLGGPLPAAAATVVAPSAAVAATIVAGAGADQEDDFGDWAGAGAPSKPTPAAGLPTAAPSVPGSPRLDGRAHAVPSSAHGSPQRLPSRRSSAASSPVLDRFRSFLHAAAPQVSEQLELEEAAEEQKAAAEQQRHEAYGWLQQFAASHLPPSPRVERAAAAWPPATPTATPAVAELPPAAAGWDEDDFGSFEGANQQPEQIQRLAAAASPNKANEVIQPHAALQQPQQSQLANAAVPKGVQRDVPLPLDIFGEEPATDGAVNGMQPEAQSPSAAEGRTAAAPAANLECPQPKAQSPSAAGAAAAAGAPAAVPSGVLIAASGTAAGGSEWDDDFTDFVSCPPAAAVEAVPAPSSAVQHPVPAGSELQLAVAPPALAAEPALELATPERLSACQPAAGHALAAAVPEAGSQPPFADGGFAAGSMANGSRGSPAVAAGAVAAATDWPDVSKATAAAGKGERDTREAANVKAEASEAAAPAPPLPVPPQQPVSPSSAGSAGSRQSALLAALHPVSSAASSARSSFEQPLTTIAAAPAQQWGGVPPAVPLAATAVLAGGGSAWQTAAAAKPTGARPGLGQELVQEYAVAWARLLEAAAAQLQASAALWAEAGSSGCWRDLQQLLAAQQHLAACAQLYHAASIVRLAAQQLGLYSLVGELQEAWAQVEAAWLCSTASTVTSSSGSGGAEPAKQQQQQQQQQADLACEQQPAFHEAALAAWQAACTVGVGSPAAVQGLLQSAAAQLEAMSLDDFPRMLAWSQGLCGLTLLPLSLFEGVLLVAPWEALDRRPCLVPLANVWLHRVSSRAPQLD